MSAMFDGKRFTNQVPLNSRSFLRWVMNRQRGPWPRFRVKVPHSLPNLADKDSLSLTWINHASVLLRVQGLNLLTDPIWSDRASPVSFAGPHRVQPPGVLFSDLPRIHGVLISHDHYDHLDLSTLRRLKERHQPRFYCGRGLGKWFLANGLGAAVEMDWWESVEVGSGLRLTSVPAQHFSGRSLWDRFTTLWMGFLLQTEKGPVYFAGDTGQGPHFRQICERLGAPRLSFLPIGAYLPRWFMGPVHLSPDEAVQAHHELRSQLSVAIHFDTFPLADEAFGQAPRDLRAALEKAGVPPALFRVLEVGESLIL